MLEGCWDQCSNQIPSSSVAVLASLPTWKRSDTKDECKIKALKSHLLYYKNLNIHCYLRPDHVY